MLFPKPVSKNKKKKAHKYNAKKTERSGMWFDSMAEAKLYDWLKLRESNKEITDLKCQVEVRLTQAQILYKPDFSFVENGILIYAEMKGFQTPVWRIKRRLWLSGYGPGKLEVWGISASGPFLHEVLEPKELKNKS